MTPPAVSVFYSQYATSFPFNIITICTCDHRATFRTTGWLRTVNISVGRRWWAGSVSSTWKTRFYDPPHTQSINATDQWPLGSHATYLATRAPSGVAADVTVTVPTLLPWRTINRFSYCPCIWCFIWFTGCHSRSRRSRHSRSVIVEVAVTFRSHLRF